MKKNKFMRLASGLLVGTLLTTCAISGTFAKYTTQDAANDSARVAKWGVELQIIGTLYGENYLAGTNTVTNVDTDALISVESEQTSSVRSGNDELVNVVAPGTKADSVYSLKLTGKPEVDFNISGLITSENVYLSAGTYGAVKAVDVEVTSENVAKLIAAETKENGVLLVKTTAGVYRAATTGDVGNNEVTGFYTLEDMVTVTDAYYPVVYQTTDIKTNTDASDSIKNIAEYFAKQLNSVGNISNEIDVEAEKVFKSKYTINKDYETNFDLSTLLLADEDISWSWNYTDTDNTVGDDADEDDKADTILGNLQANDVEIVKLDTTSQTYKAPTDNVDYNLETSFSIDLTVTQLD